MNEPWKEDVANYNYNSEHVPEIILQCCFATWIPFNVFSFIQLPFCPKWQSSTMLIYEIFPHKRIFKVLYRQLMDVQFDVHLIPFIMSVMIIDFNRFCYLFLNLFFGGYRIQRHVCEFRSSWCCWTFTEGSTKVLRDLNWSQSLWKWKYRAYSNRAMRLFAINIRCYFLLSMSSILPLNSEKLNIALFTYVVGSDHACLYSYETFKGLTKKWNLESPSRRSVKTFATYMVPFLRI